MFRLLIGFFNCYFSPKREFARTVFQITGIRPVTIGLYEKAFRHRSKYPSVLENNERLELLGDSVFSTIVTEHLHKRFFRKTEGDLTKIRSQMVSRKVLNSLGESQRLDLLLQFTANSRQLPMDNLWGNCLEALIGAIFLDQGYAMAKRFAGNKILIHMDDLDTFLDEQKDYKSLIIEWAQGQGKKVTFNILHETIKEGRNFFTIGLFIDESLKTRGQGFSKKDASKMAAEQLFKDLGL